MSVYEQLTSQEWLQSIWAALRRIEDNLALPPAPLELPAPMVTVMPPDLTDVVEAVNQLKPGVDARDIARALAEVLSPQPVPAELPGITEFNEAVKELSWRLKGVGAQAYGGGAVSFAPGQAQAFGDAVQQTTTQTVISSVAASTTMIELGANRGTRSAMTVYNEPGASILYLKFGTGASLTSYSNRLGPGDYWESSPPKYTGPVTAVWDGTTGGARISEFLP